MSSRKSFYIIYVLLIIVLSNKFLFAQKIDYDYRDADKLFSQERWDAAATVYKYLADKNI